MDEKVSEFIPVTHSVNALRSVIASGATLSDITKEINFLIISGIILMILGILSFFYTQKKAKKIGSLGHY